LLPKNPSALRGPAFIGSDRLLSFIKMGDAQARSPSSGGDMAERRKVAFVIGSLGVGGAERVFLTLLRHLDRKLFEPHLILRHRHGELVAEIPEDVALHALDVAGRPWTLSAVLVLMWRFIRVVRSIHPHAILTCGGMNIASVAARPFLPRDTRVIVRESSVLSVRLRSDTRHPRLWAWLYRQVFRRANAIICQSESMVGDINSFGVPRRRAIRIYNPLDVEMIAKLSERGGNPYQGAAPQLVAAGRLSREKGFDLLLAAMPRVIESLPRARLAIVGSGPRKDELTEQAQALGLAEVVSFRGFQQNPWPYLRYADLLVLPSRREAFGNVLLEALALGTPVVAADCPGAIREIYGDHPAVRLVPPEDPVALAEAIIERCKSGAVAPTGARSDDDPLAKFAVRHIVDQYSAVLVGCPREHIVPEDEPRMRTRLF
jgi:glycosyltransferase involved in cell wall biosynthesis